MNNKLIAMLTIFLFLGCDTIKVTNKTASNNSDINNTGPNQAPTANAGRDQSVAQNEAINIVGSGSDSDGSIIDYAWHEGSNVISPVKDFVYSSSQVGEHNLTLTVYDDDGASASDTMVITVTP